MLSNINTGLLAKVNLAKARKVESKEPAKEAAE
jgi:hypothetical protein